jgi:hypothetical protein
MRFFCRFYTGYCKIAAYAQYMEKKRMKDYNKIAIKELIKCTKKLPPRQEPR